VGSQKTFLQNQGVEFTMFLLQADFDSFGIWQLAGSRAQGGHGKWPAKVDKTDLKPDGFEVFLPAAPPETRPQISRNELIRTGR